MCVRMFYLCVCVCVCLLCVFCVHKKRLSKGITLKIDKDKNKNKNFIKGFTQDFLKVYLETVRSESYWFNHSSDRHRLLFDFQTIPGFLELILWYKLPAKHNVLSKLTKQWHSFSLYTSEVGCWLCK